MSGWIPTGLSILTSGGFAKDARGLAMNKERASQILLEQLEKAKALSYAQLKTFVLQGKSDNYDLIDGGKTYEIEIQYFWDSGKPGNIRVAGAINESGGWSAYRPHSEDFIIRPDGSFIE